MSIILRFISAAGLLLLAFIVVLAILALAGHFDPKFTNPPS